MCTNPDRFIDNLVSNITDELKINRHRDRERFKFLPRHFCFENKFVNTSPYP